MLDHTILQVRCDTQAWPTVSKEPEVQPCGLNGLLLLWCTVLCALLSGGSIATSGEGAAWVRRWKTAVSRQVQLLPTPGPEGMNVWGLVWN